MEEQIITRSCYMCSDREIPNPVEVKYISGMKGSRYYLKNVKMFQKERRSCDVQHLWILRKKENENITK